MDGDLVSETKEFERELAMHTAPAMLGIKPANLLTVEGSSGFISGNMARFNSIAAEKGLHIKELRRIGRRSLMLLYNEKLLADRLEEKEVRKELSGMKQTVMNMEKKMLEARQRDRESKEIER